ncbi:hypothetical protein MOQ_005555 [Trypanosoma cruzi marinkellei]|uniref:Uncharacterized protein n=1 Tax=Trypanosoma cruzi marinkellei TaxID=85056 RepID=K2N7I0_TRYCR|nr:hypothetical protein MOQ_005555 [Trypanosoma cruzi marinkellei]
MSVMEGAGPCRLPEDHRSSSFAVTVAGWLVPDVRRHLFLLVWIFGVPIHLQYVVHLIRMSAVSLEIGAGVTMTGTGKEWTSHSVMEARDSPFCPDEASLRDAALDILFVQVSADCRAANERVRKASLSTEEWSEVRSLSYRVDENGAMRVVAQDGSAKGEVLALLPAGAALLEELEAMYFTAVEQARRFREQYAFPLACWETQCKRNSKTQIRKEEHSRSEGASLAIGSEADVILVDSDGDVRSLRKPDIVILSDDGSGGSSSSSSDGYQPVKRRRKDSPRTVYELVE